MYFLELLKKFIGFFKKKVYIGVIDEYKLMPSRRLEIMRYINNTGPDP